MATLAEIQPWLKVVSFFSAPHNIPAVVQMNSWDYKIKHFS